MISAPTQTHQSIALRLFYLHRGVASDMVVVRHWKRRYGGAQKWQVTVEMRVAANHAIRTQGLSLKCDKFSSPSQSLHIFLSNLIKFILN